MSQSEKLRHISCTFIQALIVGSIQTLIGVMRLRYFHVIIVIISTRIVSKTMSRKIGWTQSVHFAENHSQQNNSRSQQIIKEDEEKSIKYLKIRSEYSSYFEE